MNNQVAVIPPAPNGDKPEIVQFTEMWPGVTFTEVGLVFSDSVTRETFEKLGRWLGTINQRSKLWIADWLMFEDVAGFGHSYEDLIEITGLQRETLHNYASIGRAVPVQNRIAGSNMSLYAAVRSLDYGTQKTMLTKATEGKWDRDMLRAAVRKLKGGKKPERIGATFPEDMQTAATLTPALATEAESTNRLPPENKSFWARLKDIFASDDAPSAEAGTCIPGDIHELVNGVLFKLRENEGLKEHETLRVIIYIDEEAGQ